MKNAVDKLNKWPEFHGRVSSMQSWVCPGFHGMDLKTGCREISGGKQANKQARMSLLEKGAPNMKSQNNDL